MAAYQKAVRSSAVIDVAKLRLVLNFNKIKKWVLSINALFQLDFLLDGNSFNNKLENTI